MKIAGIIGIILSLVLVIYGFTVSVPGSYLSSYSVTEYVGGDAYNYIMEASLRGGEISGAMTQKAVYISVGCLTFVMSLCALMLDKKLDDMRGRAPRIGTADMQTKTFVDDELPNL